MVDKLKKKYNLKTYGCDVLKAVAEKIEVFDKDLKELADDMILMMNFFDGIGLAAPQIGISKRVVVLGVPNACDNQSTLSIGEIMLLPKMPLVLVNPEIIEFSSNMTPYEEGCLSLPEVYGSINRPESIIFKAQDLDGKEFQYECSGLLARCIQHEVDHLNGLVFIDRASDDVLKKLDFKLFRLQKQGKKREYNRAWKR